MTTTDKITIIGKKLREISQIREKEVNRKVMRTGDEILAIELQKKRYLTFNRREGAFVVSDRHGEDNAFLMSIESFNGFVDELTKIFGSSAAVIIQKGGYGAGRRSAKHVLQSDDVIKEIESIFNSPSRWGFGRYELIKFDRENHYIKFVLHNSVFARPVDDHNYSNAMHYLIGFYKGYFSALFGRELECKEVKCLSLGEKYCEFEVGSKLPTHTLDV